MDVKLITMGKTDVKWVAEGFDTYVSRLKRHIPFVVVEIPQLKGVASVPEEEVKKREGQLILKRIAPSDEVFLLDEKGKEYSSVGFSAFLEDRLSRSRGSLVFVIGGAFGFSDEVYGRADGLVSLSRMTFSHQMVRTIFAEQLYRACTILKGEPYHHG